MSDWEPTLSVWETSFQALSDRLLASLTGSEELSLELSGEHSQFIRFNRAKVRQTGLVRDARVKVQLIEGDRTAALSLPFTGDLESDFSIAQTELTRLRQELPQLPVDPYLVRPKTGESSHQTCTGELLPANETVASILGAVPDLDFTGFYAAGPIVRANRNSAGQSHWFATETYVLDYSIINANEKAIKQTLAGSNWDQAAFEKQIHQARQQCAILERSPMLISPGQYRTYFAPDAVAELAGMFSWGGISEMSLRKGGSALAKLHSGQSLSCLFNLQENFTHGTVPRFNEVGEIAPETLPLIGAGELLNTLVNSRTAQEYGITANGANLYESLRALEIAPGELDPAEVLEHLGTGLYLSNLHYLNWSDRAGGRITGMTRYACFWVEGGEIVAPIQDLRFDDSLYSFLGPNLEALTQTQAYVPAVDTYEARSLGGAWVPGMMVRAFTFTL
jgi:predicted Zn-dependent protease